MTDSHLHLSQPTPRWCSCAVPDDELSRRSAPTRRGVVLGASAASVLAAAGWPSPAAAAPAARDGSVTITVMGTSDLHANVVNWDYYKDATYSDTAGNTVGLARVASVVKQIRADRGREHTLLFDAGDTIQGTPLGFYYATVEPTTETGAIHPMAAQMNALGYDAVALGNHEFNYGLDFLDHWIDQMDAPVLAANAVHAGTQVPRFRPYTITTMKVKGRPPIRVGVLGLTNPGVVIWDKANVSGKVEVQGLVEAAARWVPVMRREGADVIVVSAHSGDSGTSSYGGDLPVENAAALVAQQVPGIDAILFGHAHVDVPQRFVTNVTTGKQVIMSEPKNWGQRVSVFDLKLEFVRGSWQVAQSSALTVNTNTVVDDPAFVAIVRDQHAAVVKYMNTPVATSTEAMSAAEACWKDTAILDYVNEVQVATVTAAIAGTPEASLPVISHRRALQPLRELPGGAGHDQGRRRSLHLRQHAHGFGAHGRPDQGLPRVLGEVLQAGRTRCSGRPRRLDQCAVPDPTSPTTPDYNYDQFSGVDYSVDISQPVGSRITGMSYEGVPVAADQKFVVAVNNYRQSGGGGFPHIASAPVIYNAQVAIREAIVAYASAAGTIDPASFHVENWRLVRNGVPVF